MMNSSRSNSKSANESQSGAVLQRFHQRLQELPSVINLQVLHCHQIQTARFTDHVVQRLDLPDRLQARYQSGIGQVPAFYPRFIGQRTEGLRKGFEVMVQRMPGNHNAESAWNRGVPVEVFRSAGSSPPTSSLSGNDSAAVARSRSNPELRSIKIEPRVTEVDAATIARSPSNPETEMPAIVPGQAAHLPVSQFSGPSPVTPAAITEASPTPVEGVFRVSRVPIAFSQTPSLLQPSEPSISLATGDESEIRSQQLEIQRQVETPHAMPLMKTNSGILEGSSDSSGADTQSVLPLASAAPSAVIGHSPGTTATSTSGQVIHPSESSSISAPVEMFSGGDRPALGILRQPDGSSPSSIPTPEVQHPLQPPLPAPPSMTGTASSLPSPKASESATQSSLPSTTSYNPASERDVPATISTPSLAIQANHLTTLVLRQPDGSSPSSIPTPEVQHPLQPPLPAPPSMTGTASSLPSPKASESATSSSLPFAMPSPSVSSLPTTTSTPSSMQEMGSASDRSAHLVFQQSEDSAASSNPLKIQRYSSDQYSSEMQRQIQSSQTASLPRSYSEATRTLPASSVSTAQSLLPLAISSSSPGGASAIVSTSPAAVESQPPHTSLPVVLWESAPRGDRPSSVLQRESEFSRPFSGWVQPRTMLATSSWHSIQAKAQPLSLPIGRVLGQRLQVIQSGSGERVLRSKSMKHPSTEFAESSAALPLYAPFVNPIHRQEDTSLSSARVIPETSTLTNLDPSVPSSTATSASAEIDIAELAEQVSRLLARRLVVERERRGIEL